MKLSSHISGLKNKLSQLFGAEASPYTWINKRSNVPILIIGDHTGQGIPKRLNNLGMPAEDLEKHIAYDIGTPDIVRYLSQEFDAPAIMATYSRLVADCNRKRGQPEVMPEVSDHISVPANVNMTDKERSRRMADIYEPYRAAIAQRVDASLQQGVTPLLLFIHSFTPEMNGVKRSCGISVMWKNDPATADRLVAALHKNNPDIRIGLNEPYSQQDPRFAGSNVDASAGNRGLPHIVIEFRQDLVDTPEKARGMAKMFMEAVQEVLKQQASLSPVSPKNRPAL